MEMETEIRKAQTAMLEQQLQELGQQVDELRDENKVCNSAHGSNEKNIKCIPSKTLPVTNNYFIRSIILEPGPQGTPGGFRRRTG